MTTGTQTDEWKQAYNLLNVPPSSSPESIKKAYRRLIKRWHPDRYQSGTPAYDQATQMTKQINEAYSQISSAPLGYDRPQASAPRTPASPVACSPLDPSEEILRDLSPNIGRRIDFWTQVIGRAFFTALVLFGLFFHASLMMPAQPIWRFAGFLAVNLACGLAIAEFVSKFEARLKKDVILVALVLFCVLFSGLTLCAFINPELVIIFILLIIAVGFATIAAALALKLWRIVQDYRANRSISSFSEF